MQTHPVEPFALSPRAPAFVRAPSFAAVADAMPSRSELLRCRIAEAQRGLAR